MKPEHLQPLVLALALSVVVAGCGPKEIEEPLENESSKPALEQVFTDQVTIETVDGQRKWTLKSKQMQKFSGVKDVLLVELVMDFYRDANIFSTLTADSGRVNPDTHNVHAWGNVVVVTDDGRRLDTQELFFDNNTQLITNEVFDHYVWSDGEATGIGMEASADLEYFEIKQKFRSKISDENPGPQEGP